MSRARGHFLGWSVHPIREQLLVAPCGGRGGREQCVCPEQALPRGQAGHHGAFSVGIGLWLFSDGAMGPWSVQGWLVGVQVGAVWKQS